MTLASVAMNKEHAVIATNRFGLGARPGEIAAAGADPRAWLQSQLGTPPVFSSRLNTGDALTQLQHFKMAKRANKSGDAKPAKQNPSTAIKPGREFLHNANVTLEDAIASKNSFSWRLLDFFFQPL